MELSGVVIGDYFSCVLEGGGDMLDHPLEYDAIFKSVGGAINFIQSSNFPNPVIHKFLYLGGGKWKRGC